MSSVDGLTLPAGALLAGLFTYRLAPFRNCHSSASALRAARLVWYSRRTSPLLQDKVSFDSFLLPPDTAWRQLARPDAICYSLPSPEQGACSPLSCVSACR